jgi:hypothetical protein
MRARVWLPLAGPLALSAWLAWGPGRGSAPDLAPPEREAAASTRSGAELAAPAELDLPAAEGEPRHGLTAAAPEPLEPRQVVRGRVVTPPGAPRDETLVVRAFGAKPRELELGATLASRSTGTLTSAPVDAAGAFELELPPEAGSTWLQVDGRYLALAEPVLLALPASGEPVLRPRLGAWIHGVAHGAAEGQPVLAGWDVGGSLPGDPEGSPPLRFALADAGGRFDLRALPAPGTWWVGTRAEESAVALRRGLDVAPGGAVELELESGPGAVVSGRVVFAAEEPADAGNTAPDDGVAGIAVSAFAAAHAELSGLGWLAPVARTAADGSFALTGLALGSTRIVASEGLCAAETLELEVSGDVEGVRLVVDASATFSGRVLLPDGAPAAGARVSAVQRGRSSSLRSDAEGRFRFPCLDPEHRVELEARSRLPDGTELFAKGSFTVRHEAELVLATVSAAAREPLPGPDVVGRVLGPDGSPIAGAEVFVARQDTTDAPMPPWMEGQGSPDARTDALGRFELSSWSLEGASLAARADGFAPSQLVALPAGVGGPAAPRPAVDLVLRPAGALHGGVYADGHTQPRFAVIAYHRDGGDGQTASTDAEGAYRFDALLPGAYVLIAKPLRPAGASYEEMLELQRREELRASADVVAGADVRVDLGAPLAQPVRVFGRVTAGGEPRQAQLVFVPDGGSPFADARKCLADERGGYEVELGPGSHRRYVMTAGRRAMSARFDVIEVPVAVEHRLDVELPSGRIRGRVLAEDPIEGTEVAAFRLDDSGGERAFGIAETDAEGAFAIEGLAPGGYQVLVDRGVGGIAFRPARVDLAPDDDVQVELRGEPSGELRVTAVDGSGKGVPGARIVVLAGDLVLTGRAETGADGNEVVRHLAPGACRVLVTAPDLAGEGSFEVVAGAETAARIELSLAGMLRVEVVDDEGAPVRAAVAVTGKGTSPVIPDLRSLLEGADPIELSTTLRGPLPLGRYEVTATAADGRTATRSVRIAAPGERKVRIRLRD